MFLVTEGTHGPAPEGPLSMRAGEAEGGAVRKFGE